jgi:glycosyltransferase involved in cell wall biosynthesis
MTRSTQRAEEISAEGFAPVLVHEIELSEPLPVLAGSDANGGYAEVLCLARLHGSPLGSLRVELPAGGLSPARLAEIVQAELGAAIGEHLLGDGLAVAELSADGLTLEGTPPCQVELERLRGDAPRVSVVIPTRNRPASALETLGTVLRSNYPHDRFEAIVVDNGSGADERIDPNRLPEGPVPVRLVQEEDPGGSNARNAGLWAATGEIVAFCDDDVLVDGDWLASLALAFHQDDRVGGAAGLTLPRELETPAQVWYEGFASADRGLTRRVLDRRNPPADRPLFPFTIGDLGSGENFAFRRELLLELGGFDPALGTATATLGGEDVEAMFRVLLSNRQVVYEPRAIVRHSHQREFEQFERRVWGYGVGLTACLTKVLRQNPRLLPELLRKLPGGIAYALSPGSAKNESKPADYPARLTRLELRGMAYGPLAYARSRRATRRSQKARRDPSTPSTPGPLRAMIITDSYWPLIGGANRSVELLAQNLARAGHTVAVATAWQEGIPTLEDQGPVRVHRIRDLTSRMRWISEDPYKHNPPPFPDPEAVWRLRRLIAEFDPDIVHAYGWLTHSTAVALLGRRVPLLISARSYGNICAVHNLVHKQREICEGPAPLKCLACSADNYGAAKGMAAVAGVLGSGPVLRRKTTAIHSVSRFVAAKMDRYLRVEGVRNEVVPNFHEDVSEKPVDAEMLAQLPDRPFIFYVGAFRRIKGIEELFAAYEALEGPPPLVLAGTRAPDTPEFPEGVTVIEDVPYPTLLAMWERAMFGVFPTKIPEALGNVVHEAMSKGRAVIGTRPGGHEDMIEDGEDGLLVPAGDAPALAAAMSRLVEDRDLRERLEIAALRRAADFTPEVVMPQMEHLYRETIADFQRSKR